MSDQRIGGFAACGFALLLVVTAASAEDTAVLSGADNQNQEAAEKIGRREPTRFIRVRYDEFKSPVALQTASAKYVLPGADGRNKLEVVLESVIHIGDRSYYREFNRRFRHYDAVLYELVAPPEKLIPDPAEPNMHPLRILQQVSAEGLGFSSQIDEIDYKAPNMVHSDLSPEALAKVTEGRGDDEMTMLLEMMTEILRKKNLDEDTSSDTSDPDGPSAAIRSDGDNTPPTALPRDDDPPSLTSKLRILSDPEGAVKIRRLLAKGFDAAPSLEAMLRPSQQATLIKARNARALEIFQEQLDTGKRRIALFWGAGHMADFERELVLHYGVQPTGIVWRDAWDLRDGAVEFSPLEAILEKTLRGSLKDAARNFLRATGEPESPE